MDGMRGKKGVHEVRPAREDAGRRLAAGAGEGVLFDHGERVEALPEGQLVDALLARIRASGA